ncbi:MAG: hypothetical protein Q4C06_07730, partial [Bacillota bacterium]|nr:hypothetical protein [Bacillota bacterium]
MKDKFDRALNDTPFQDYSEYMEYLFACVNFAMDAHLTQMKRIFATGQGGYKNVLYPDLEVASDICTERIERFRFMDKEAHEETFDEGFDELTDELFSLFGDFAEESEQIESVTDAVETEVLHAWDRLEMIEQRAAVTVEAGIALPFYSLYKKLNMDQFTVFCFICGILASTQTDYAGVYQVINENGSLSAPTIESAAKLYFGDSFSIAGAYGEMSTCLEQLMPVLNLYVQGSMPFSTVVSPDKRMIDYLFGKNPMRLDENYIRFFKMLT